MESTTYRQKKASRAEAVPRRGISIVFVLFYYRTTVLVAEVSSLDQRMLAAATGNERRVPVTHIQSPEARIRHLNCPLVVPGIDHILLNHSIPTIAHISSAYRLRARYPRHRTYHTQSDPDR